MSLFLVLGGLLAAASPVAPAAAATPPPPPYLDPAVTGATYCFDPDSPTLRATFPARPFTPGARVDSAALAEDVRFLHQLLRTTYSGWPELLQHRTFDPDRFFESWSQKVAAAGPTVSLEEGVLAPTVAIRQALTDSHFGPDGMLAALSNDERLAFREYQAPPPEGLKVETCDALSVPGVQADTLRVAPVVGLDDARSQRVTVSAQGAGESLTLRCGTSTLELKRRPVPVRPPDPGADVYTYQPLGDVGLITLRNFKGPPEAQAQLRQFVADYSKHRRHKLLVFDFRGNSGGDDGPMYAWLDQAVRGTWFAPGEVRVQGAFSPCFHWNLLVRRQLRDGRLDTPEGRAEQQALRAKWPAPPVPSRPVFDSGRVEGHAKAPFTGRIAILVDRNSVSSGESAAEALHRATGAPRVGERTGGFVTYGNAPGFVLPRTGLAWVVPTKRNYFEAPVEGVGHEVDVYLAPEDVRRPATELLPLLRRLR